MNKLFLDTSYAVALSSATDANHERAVELADEMETSDLDLLQHEPYYSKLETPYQEHVIELLQ